MALFLSYRLLLAEFTVVFQKTGEGLLDLCVIHLSLACADCTPAFMCVLLVWHPWAPPK